PQQQPVAAAPQPQHHQAPVQQQPRMPQVTDFPPQVQAEINRAPAPAPEHEDRGPMGLLKRLTAGLSRREEDDHTATPPEPRLRQAEPRRQESQFYAPARGQLDDQGRLVQQTRHQQEEDQLEIPAFLRRQAN